MSSSPIPPAFVEQARLWLKKYYGLVGELKSLYGEVDYNFLVSVPSGEEYTLKISRIGTELSELEFQVAILEHLREVDLAFQVPQLVVATNGHFVVTVNTETGQQHHLRVQTWVPGRLLDEVQPRSTALLQQWGQTTAQLNLALRSFDHPYAHRSYKWDPSRTLESRPHGQWFTETQQEIADYFWDRFENKIKSQLSRLRNGVNYNDAHEQNLLVNSDKQAPQISGVIDFGDALYTQTINELAIACAYAIMGQADPLSAACQVVKGFHELAPLEEQEVAVLYDMIAARLLITVATAAKNLRAEPDNTYLQVSAQPAWQALKKWQRYTPALAHYRLRAACGWEAVPARISFNKWIAAQNKIHPVMPLEGKHLVPLDLGVASLDLGNN